MWLQVHDFPAKEEMISGAAHGYKWGTQQHL